MKYLINTFAICMSIALVTGQLFGSSYQNFDSPRSFGLHSLTSDFGASSFGGSFASQQRDSRQDRGPVVFPPSPPDAPEETSGVIVGASGYGFVPPGQPQYRNEYPSSESSHTNINEINSGYYQQHLSYF